MANSLIIKDILNIVEEFAPLHIQESWDNSGLCVGDENAEAKGVLLALDCSSKLIDEAVKIGANLIITHHPLIFNKLKNIRPDNEIGEVIIKAIKNDIAIYSTHTSADKVLGGVSGAMAKRLGLENIELLDKEDDNFGLGVVGDLLKAMSSQEVISFVKEKFNLIASRCSKPIDKPIKRIAMCGGSGSSLITKAMDSGAQLYISADISYHHFFTAKDFMIMDIGHFESEVEIVSVIYSILKKKMPNFAVTILSEIEKSNPIYYI